jgi:hypothetical protein
LTSEIEIFVNPELFCMLGGFVTFNILHVRDVMFAPL